jgi:subtilisin family serine protease
MSETKEYIVSLKKDVDYDEFWDQIENQRANDSFVPSRRVEIVNNRDLSIRSCHYALTDEEANLLRLDPRVAAVAIPPNPSLKALSLIQEGNFSRTTGGTNNSWINWGLRRCVLEDLESIVGSEYPYCIDGSGVDIVIQDNGVMSGHPEWQDSTGITRFVEHDWYQAAGVPGSMPTGHYGDVGDHGTHVAGIAAGKTYGWAKGARIYSIRYDLFESDAFDLIKTWHLNKPVDPVTGVKRPTIVNASWGYRWFYNNGGNGGSIVNRTYRGITTTSSVTSSASGMVNNAHNFTYTPADVDQEELTDAGVICVRAAGNYFHKIDEPGGVDWDNNYTYSTSWALGSVPAGQPIYYHRSGSPWSPDTIIVSNIDSAAHVSTLEQLASSSERGPGVFISAPGSSITSATRTNGFPGANSRYPFNQNYYIARISGTSMAAPQVTGVLALYLQVNPKATADDCKNWLANIASKNNKVYSTGLDNDYTNSRSLMGQQNKFLYSPYGVDVGFTQSGSVAMRNIVVTKK